MSSFFFHLKSLELVGLHWATEKLQRSQGVIDSQSSKLKRKVSSVIRRLPKAELRVFPICLKQSWLTLDISSPFHFQKYTGSDNKLSGYPKLRQNCIWKNKVNCHFNYWTYFFRKWDLFVLHQISNQSSGLEADTFLLCEMPVFSQEFWSWGDCHVLFVELDVLFTRVLV